MRVAVCDTGPLLHLSEVGRLDLLGYVGTVVVPAVVAEELDSHLPGWSSSRPEWIRIDALDSEAARLAIAWEASGILHAGEAESVALARQVKCDWYLTDDAAARIFASPHVSGFWLCAHSALCSLAWLLFITRPCACPKSRDIASFGSAAGALLPKHRTKEMLTESELLRR